VINNTQAPAYKIVKYINKKVHHLLSLPNNYNTKNSYEISEELNKIKINENSRIITLDIKDLYVNLPLNGIMHATKYWLNKNNNSEDVIKQLLNIIKTVIQQNYFQYKDTFYQPVKCIAMGSPLSGTIAEMYLQYVEETYIKQRWDTNEIMYYKRCVDDILIIYNNQKMKDHTIEKEINKTDMNLEFKMTTEDNNNIHYLDLTLQRNNNNIQLSIYRKPTDMDTTIHFQSSHPHEQKIVAFRYYINRMYTLPINEKARKEEWNTIVTMAINSGYPKNIIYNQRKSLQTEKITMKQKNKEKSSQKMDYIHILQSYDQKNNKPV